jgi:alpha-mannosidase
MSTMITKLDEIKKKCSGYWSERIISQLEYACNLSKVNGGKYEGVIGKAIDFLAGRYDGDSAITRETAQKAEEIILELSVAAKSFKMVCAAHAHIDMNWMWGFAETVAVTLDTFRTMLNLMNEYPGFKFSQSQASVYRIVEEYDPAMLEEIRKRVKEGRWEVTASTWVETDKNMPNGESLSRHILYTKKYLSRLLGINPGSLKIDFEPDTFGHNQNVPEILTRGGVKYYYHCRGDDGYNIYRWESPSGSSVLVYREPFWYNSEISPEMALHVPGFCTKHGIDAMLKVYGVGNHGGGPTRRDIEKIIDMNAWPVFPGIRFGTFIEYFDLLEKISNGLPVVKGELNFIFTGCYTTQTRIKMANRIGEAKLNESESFSTISALFANGKYRSESFEKAWEKLLFNHFHDILPGSGVIDTREYAMGQFQQVLAAANTEQSLALSNIASQIDTSGLVAVEEDIRETVSEGAGVGFGIGDFGIPQAERGRGKTRIIHFFNPSAHQRTGPAEIVVWDWEGDKERCVLRNTDGTIVRHQVMDNDKVNLWDGRYWGHKYMKLLVDVEVPAYGYNTYTLSENEMKDLLSRPFLAPRVEKPDSYVLENDYVKVTFDPKNASIVSMIEKSAGMEMIDAKRPSGVFRLIEEDDSKGMTAWIVGRYMNITCLNENVKIRKVHIDKSSLRQYISYEMEFRNSKLNVTISLDYCSPRLDYSVECDWQEAAVKGKYIPQLNFYMPLGYNCRSYKYDIPFGTIIREGMDMDVPANSWAVGLPEEDGQKAIMLVTNSKYGFRGYDNSLSITLIRSSYDPDPYPDNGIHKFKFAVDMVHDTSNGHLIKEAYDYNHPISFVSGTSHGGTLPYKKSFMALESGNAAISAVKMPECDGAGGRMIIRVYETDGRKTQVVLKFAEKVKKAYFVDINEKPEDNGLNIYTAGENVAFEVNAYTVSSICVEF